MKVCTKECIDCGVEKALGRFGSRKRGDYQTYDVCSSCRAKTKQAVWEEFISQGEYGHADAFMLINPRTRD